MFTAFAVFVGVVVFGLLYGAEAIFVSSENEEEEKKRDRLGCFCAVIVGLCCFFAGWYGIKLTHGSGSPLSVVLFLIMAGCFLYLIFRWRSKSVGGIKALLLYIIAAGLSFCVMMVTAEAVAVWLKDGMLSRFVVALPICFLIGTIAAFVFDWVFSIHEVKKLRAQTDEEKKEARSWKITGLIIVVAATIAIVAILLSSVGVSNLFASIPWPKTDTQANETETEETEVETETETEVETEAEAGKAEEEAQKLLTVMQVTDEELEELTLEKYNFSDILLTSSLSVKDKERTEAAGFSDALTFGFESSEDEMAFIELKEEIFRNPIYGNAVIDSIKDKTIGSVRIGELNPWMDVMSEKNKANGISCWLEHRGTDKTFYVTHEWRRYAATLCTWLERLVMQGRHTWMTTENWPLNMAAKNSDRFGVPASYQYAKEALILAYVGKDAGSLDGIKPGTGLFVIGFNIHDKRPEFYGGTPEEPNPTPSPSPQPEPQPEPEPQPTPGPSPGPGPGPDPTPGVVKDPADDSVNNGNADKGGGDNRSDGTENEYQPADERTENYSGSENDNNHGYSDPGSVTPETPAVEPQHSSESVVDDENKMNYETDVPTERGPADETSEPTTSEGGDGEFTPDD